VRRPSRLNQPGAAAFFVYAISKGELKMNAMLKALIACTLLTSLSEAQTYVFSTFQNPGASVTRVFGLNGHGELVGADNTLPGRHAFLVNRGDYSTLDPSGTLGAQISFARGINNVGDIVGGYFDNDGNEHGFLLHQGALTTLDVPFAGSIGTQLNSLNDAGTIVGVWVDSAFTAHGFIYEKGSFSHLDYPGALDSFPYGINSSGEIAGNWDSDQSTVGHGFVFANGKIFSIDAPGAIQDGTAADGINDKGQVVGSYVGQDGNSHGFLAEGGRFTTLDCAAGANTAIWGINAAGQIAGTCDVPGQRRGFVADRLPMKKP
jgi:probable HAF family extracellular repeat protein